MNFDNKKICLTGASSGIGEALLRELVKWRCTILIGSRSTDRLQELAKELGSDSAEIHVSHVDLENEKSIESFVAFVDSKVDCVDILINNAGISQRGLAVETNIDVVKKIMQINFSGTVYLTSKFGQLMSRSSDPQIGVISSVAGEFGFPQRSAYSASKHALKGYFESMQLESNSPAVTIVSPGGIKTNISVNALDTNGAIHGKMDTLQSGGVDVNIAANKILSGLYKKKRNVYIGTKEVLLMFIHRYCPPLFRLIVKKVNGK